MYGKEISMSFWVRVGRWKNGNCPDTVEWGGSTLSAETLLSGEHAPLTESWEALGAAELRGIVGAEG